MKANWQLDKGEKRSEHRKILHGDMKTVKGNPDTRAFVAKNAKRGAPNRKQELRLFRRLADYSATVASKPGYHRPGSMQ